MMLKDLFDQGIPPGAADVPVIGLTSDSRKVGPGTVFAALRGSLADGHDFIPEALARGAVAILSDRPAETGGVPVVQDAEPRRALALAAARLYPGQPDVLVAVTGTNGKSSTVDFLRQIWQRGGYAAASMGTLGAVGPEGRLDLGHTTPDPVAIHATLDTLAGQGVSHCAMEASSHGLAQFRLDGVRLSAVAFTNLTQDHLDYHSSMEAYRAAKLRLFSDLSPAGIPAVINADSPESRHFAEAAGAAGLAPFSVGWRGRDLKIEELMPKAVGQALFLNHAGREVRVDLPLIGEFQALNALTAAGLALALDMGFDAVAEGLSRLEPVKGRMEYVGQTGAGAPVFVDYAHTPDGLDVLLRAVRPHTAGRLFVVFGCGGDRDRSKRPLMGAVARRQADRVIVTDDNPRTEAAEAIRAAILQGVPDAREIADRAEAIRAAVAELRAGDTLVIAGKGHETGQIVGETVLPFSDQATAAAALQEVGHG